MSKLALLTKDQARKLVTEINAGASEIGAKLIQFRDQKGWETLGYKTFTACCEKEFSDLYGSRSQVYRLMQQVEVSANVSPNGAAAPLLPITQTRELGKLEPEAQPGALDAAKAAGNGVATTETVVAAVEAAASKSATSKKPSTKLLSGYEEALERIGKVCGKDVRAAIENGMLGHVTQKEAVAWAKLKDPDEIKELVVAKRWTPTKAHAFLQRMPGPQTRVQDLLNLCIAMGGHYEATVTGFEITISQRKGKR